MLVDIKKPTLPLEQTDEKPIEVDDWTFTSYRDEEGRYYEYGLREDGTERWMRLEVSDGE